MGGERFNVSNDALDATGRTLRTVAVVTHQSLLGASGKRHRPDLGAGHSGLALHT